MKYYLIEPEVAGELGEHTIASPDEEKRSIQRLHYEFDGWLGDELLESTPYYIVSERLAHEIARTRLTGVGFNDVEITVSQNFRQLYHNRQLPKFLWLKVDGKAGKDDFGIALDLRLVISERALDVLKRMGVSHAASILNFTPDIEKDKTSEEHVR